MYDLAPLTLGAADLEALSNDGQQGARGVAAHPGGAVVHQRGNLNGAQEEGMLIL